MTTSRARQLLTDGFGRVAENVPAILEGLTVADLLWQPRTGANSIGWLLWHIGRMEDAQVAGIAGAGDVWTSEGWHERFDLPYPRTAIGYGQSPDDVAAFRLTEPQLLADYYTAVHDSTVALLERLDDADFDRVIDEHWDPPVTAAVRLVSIVDDAAQHVGQAAYLKGLLERMPE